MDEQAQQARDWNNMKMQTGLGPDAQPPVPCPPRQWADCGIEQKVKRLRDEVAGLRVRSEWWVSETQRLQEMIERFIGHSHDALGHVVVPFRSRYDGAGMVAKSESQFDPLA